MLKQNKYSVLFCSDQNN